MHNRMDRGAGADPVLLRHRQRTNTAQNRDVQGAGCID